MDKLHKKKFVQDFSIEYSVKNTSKIVQPAFSFEKNGTLIFMILMIGAR